MISTERQKVLSGNSVVRIHDNVIHCDDVFCESRAKTATDEPQTVLKIMENRNTTKRNRVGQILPAGRKRSPDA